MSPDAQKIYFSGPLTRCNERTTDGHRVSRDGDWNEVWAQLGGTSLSIWDMKAIDEANRRGGQAPPSYINVTDAVSPLIYLFIEGGALMPTFPSLVSSPRESRDSPKKPHNS